MCETYHVGLSGPFVYKYSILCVRSLCVLSRCVCVCGLSVCPIFIGHAALPTLPTLGVPTRTASTEETTDAVMSRASPYTIALNLIS